MLSFKLFTLWVKFGFAKLLNSESLSSACLCSYPRLQLSHCYCTFCSCPAFCLAYLWSLKRLVAHLTGKLFFVLAVFESSNSWLVVWWKYLFIWQVRYRLEFCYWRSFFVALQNSRFLLKLKNNCCIAAIRGWSRRKGERQREAQQNG